MSSLRLVAILGIAVLVVNYFLLQNSFCNNEKTNSGARFSQFLNVSWEQNDSRIVEYILANGYLLPSGSGEYNLSQPDVDPSTGQSEIVKKVFRNKTGGFFIECGALDGETRSNTLALEREFKWKGLLIEADPSNYKLMKSKNRKAWSAGCCLSIFSYPHAIRFKPGFNMGQIVNDSVRMNETILIKFFPLFALLSVLKVSTVDYFSLDVEGAELDVLQTIPFDSVRFNVLTVEYHHGNAGKLRRFMKTKGYKVLTKLVDRAL